MGDGTKENPFTREDVLKLIKENGGTARGLDLSGKVFIDDIDLSSFDLKGVVLNESIFRSRHEGAILSGAHLEGAYFIGAHLEGVNFIVTHLEGANLQYAHLEGANLWNANLEGAYLQDANLDGADFKNANLDGADLFNAEFSYNTKLDSVYWGNYIPYDEEEEKGLALTAAHTYRRLKMWYTEHGIYDVAGEFFFREMTAKRKAMKWWPNPLNRASSKIISMLCGYGERPSQVVISAIVVIFVLAIAYQFGGLDLPYSIYFSAVSFTALGYGSWAYKPQADWVQGLGVFEAFIGVFMMALFLVTFTRKMTR
jgi:uncharacterized protein YjbI with pentapeptide repeats